MRPRSNQRIRVEIIRILYDAIATTNKLAENPDETNRPKWYQTVGYLSQTINRGCCRTPIPTRRNNN